MIIAFPHKPGKGGPGSFQIRFEKYPIQLDGESNIESYMIEKKKVCLIIPTLNAGGMERVMSELANFFSNVSFIETHLIIFNSTAPSFYPLSNRIILYQQKSINEKQSRIIRLFTTLIFIRKQIKKVNAVSYLSFGERWNLLSIIASLGLKKRIFLSDRSKPGLKYRFPYMLTRRLLYPLSSGVIVQTQKAKDIVTLQKVNNKIIIIENPVRIKKPDLVLNNGKRGNIILSVGRLIKTKKFDLLIEIFKQTSFEDWKLIIIGGDAIKQNESERLIRLVKEYNLNDRVELIGYKSDVESYYLKSKIFAFTSISEGFPNVILEALSFGLPCVTFDCVAGPSDLINDGENGFLINLLDLNSFKEKLNYLMSNDEVRNEMSLAAYYSASKFSIDTIGKKYLSALFENKQEHQ